MRIKINIILGALITLLTGCRTQQAPVVPENRIMVMYGPPAYFQQQATQQQDTTSPETPQENNGANGTLPNNM
jgi:hypothetical protein